MSFPGFPGCIAVGADLDEARARAEDVTIPEDVLDRFAAERGMNRSGFLTRAARKAMEAEAGPSAGWSLQRCGVAPARL